MERRHRARPYVESRSTHTTRNLAIAGLAAVTVQLLEAPVVMPPARTVARRRWGLSHAIGGPPWLRGVLSVLLLDYTLYLWHIVVHRVPWLWRFHLVHHVALDLDATTGLRFHAGELAASIPWRAAQVVVLGVSPPTLTVWQSLTLASVLFHHSNTRLSDRMERALSWIVTAPRMHAIHHSVNPAQLQSNFSAASRSGTGSIAPRVSTPPAATWRSACEDFSTRARSRCRASSACRSRRRSAQQTPRQHRPLHSRDRERGDPDPHEPRQLLGKHHPHPVHDARLAGFRQGRRELERAIGETDVAARTSGGIRKGERCRDDDDVAGQHREPGQRERRMSDRKPHDHGRVTGHVQRDVEISTEGAGLRRVTGEHPV